MLELKGAYLPINGDDKGLNAVMTYRDLVVNSIARPKALAQLGRVGRQCVTHIQGAGQSVEEATQTMQDYEVRRLAVADCHELEWIPKARRYCPKLSSRSDRGLKGISPANDVCT